MDASTEGLELHMNTPLSLDGSFCRGTCSCMWTPGTTIQMDTKAEGLAEDSQWCVMFAMDALTDELVVAHGQSQDIMLCLLCSLWMPHQIDLLLHMDIVKIVKVYVMFAMDTSTDGLVVAYWHCYNLVVVFLCYKYIDLLWRQQS